MSNGTFNLYVGEDPKTGILDVPRITNIVGKNGDFTLTHAIGTWKGEQEESVIVTIATDTDNLAKVVANLRSELNQESIGVQAMPDITFL
jgi:hypothetical protein